MAFSNCFSSLPFYLSPTQKRFRHKLIKDNYKVEGAFGKNKSKKGNTYELSYVIFHRMELREGMKSSNYFHLFGLLPSPILDTPVIVSQGREQGIYNVFWGPERQDNAAEQHSTVKGMGSKGRENSILVPKFCMHKIIDTTSQQSFICEKGQIPCRVSQ